MSDTSSGYTPAIIAGLLVVAVLGTGIYLYYDAGRRVAEDAPVARVTPVSVAAATPAASASPLAVVGTPLTSPALAEFRPQGTVLAGQQALLIDFNEADYAAAVTSGKLVVLY